MTQTEKSAHVKDWLASGMSRPDYCRKQGLKYSTFMSWCHKELDEAEQSGKFVELPPSKPRPSKAKMTLEITFPNGIHLKYNGTLTKELFNMLSNA